MYNRNVSDIRLKVKYEPRVAIIASEFNSEIVDKLIAGAKDAFSQQPVKFKIEIIRVPGAFELPLIAKKIASQVHGCITLGAVIRGETPHFDFVASECARGLMQVSLETQKPMIFGVLTTDTLEQALDRAGGKHGNKGFDSAMNLIEMLNTLEEIISL